MKLQDWLQAWPILAALGALLTVGGGMVWQLSALSNEVAGLRARVEQIGATNSNLELSLRVADIGHDSKIAALEGRVARLEEMIMEGRSR